MSFRRAKDATWTPLGCQLDAVGPPLSCQFGPIELTTVGLRIGPFEWGASERVSQTELRLWCVCLGLCLGKKS